MRESSGAGAFDYSLHDGSLATRIQWYFLEQSRLPVAVQLWELPPGGAEGMHAHGEEQPLEELYLVVAGQARMRVDDEVHELGAGDAVLAPVGAQHDLVNTGSDTLRVVVVWGRPQPQEDFSSFGTARAALAAKRETS